MPASTLDLPKLLSEGRIAYLVRQGDEICASGVLTQLAQLDTRIEITEIDAIAPAHFGAELLDFIGSGERIARYRCHAYRTIEKFGAPLQFSAPYEVGFAWLDAAPDAGSDPLADLAWALDALSPARR